MMNAGDIAFPHLGIYLENVPRSFSVFGFEIAFYGLIIGIGVQFQQPCLLRLQCRSYAE